MAETTNHNIHEFDGNIDLSSLRKKRFTINDDPNKVLELNTSDFSIVIRLSEAYPQLNELSQKMTHLQDGVSKEDELTEKDINILSSNLSETDSEIKRIVDFIFDSNVCEVCCDNGSMLDIIHGKFRYEIIIDTITSLYESTIIKETEKLQARMDTHTRKYTSK